MKIQWQVTLTLRPGDRLCLGLKYLEDPIPLLLDNIVLDGGSFLPAFGPRLNVDFRHIFSPGNCY